MLLLSKPPPPPNLRRPLLLLLLHSFSSPSHRPPSISIPFSPPPTFNPPPPIIVSDLTSSFASWFKSGTSLFDLVYRILSSTPEGPPLDSALSSLNLALSESLVLSLLSHRPHPSSLLPSSSSSSSSSSSPILLLRLKFFDWAGHQNGPYRHTRAAFHAIFKTLQRASQSNTILQWLDHFSSHFSSSPSRHNPYAYTRFHDTLVVGYAVAGRPELALHLFAKMRFQGLDLDSYSYHVLLNSLIEASNFEFADSLAAQIDARGFHGPVTECIKVKGLCSQGKLDEAVQCVRGMKESGSDSANGTALGIMVSTLVNGLCKKGRFDEAGLLVEEFGTEEAYGSWVSSLLQEGKLDSALKFLQRKKVEEEYSPEDLHYNRLVCQFLRKNRLKEVYELLVEMIEEGIVPNKATMNAALCFFCKAGFLEVAIKLYHSRLELGLSPSKWLYNHLISGLCKSGRVEEICQVLEESVQQGYFPEKQTFRILAEMLSKEKEFNKLFELLNGAFGRPRKPSTSVLARCISALCKGGELEKAWSVGELFGERGLPLRRYRSVYFGFIRAFISLRRTDWVPELVIQMQKDRHSPSRSLYKEVVCCLCEMGKFEVVLDLLKKQLALNLSDPRTFYNYFIEGSSDAKNPEMVREVYNRMVSAGVQPNNDTEFIVLTGHLKCMRVNDAIEFFKYLRDREGPRTKLYNVFISGLCEVGKVELAVEFWKEMRNKGLIPKLNCYEELVFSLCTAKNYDTVVRVIEDFKETGRPVSSFICNCLLFQTLKGEELLRAWVDFKKADAIRGMNGGSEGSELWLDKLIAAFSGGIRKGSLHNLEEDMERYFPVDVFTYNMMLRGLTKVGHMDYACDLICRMQKKGYEPNMYTYDIMVHGYCKQGNKEEAKMWMEELTRKGYHPTWYTMRIYNDTAIFPIKEIQFARD